MTETDCGPDPGPLAPIDAARERLDRERRELAAEAAAFGTFAECVEEVSPDPPPAGTPRAPLIERQRSDAAARLRAAYGETVMAVDHYDRVYDEPLAENAVAELGPDVADLFGPDVDASFTPGFKEALLAAVETARRERTALLAALEAEQESLRTARRELDATASGRASGDAVDRIDAVAADRQHHLHSHSLPNRIDAHDLCEYLYADLDATYPVLSAVATLRDHL